MFKYLAEKIEKKETYKVYYKDLLSLYYENGLSGVLLMNPLNVSCAHQ